MRCLFFVFIFCAIGNATAAESNCFSRHLSDSIRVNYASKAYYHKLTQGASDAAFNSLISAELLVYPLARAIDFKVRHYQREGIDLWCKEFIDLSPAPVRVFVKPTRRFEIFDDSFYKQALRSALQAKDHQTVMGLSQQALGSLQDQPDFHCMTRHLFESIYRIAYFIPQRNSEAKDKGLKSPQVLMFELMGLHLKALKRTSRIDQLAAPIQAQGIPIICDQIPDLLSDLPL